MKVVINRCWGGFALSDNAEKDLNVNEDSCYPNGMDIYDDEARTYQPLIDLIEEKGSEYVSDRYAKLRIVEIPDDVDWYISDYDGMEEVEEVHRSWY